MNLGSHVGDLPGHVTANRALLQQVVGCQPVFFNQVHGTAAAVISRATPDGLAADASLTTEADVACTIMVADCLPVLFTTRCGDVVAAAHAGWRGLAGAGGQGVLESTVAAIIASFRAQEPIKRAQEAPQIIAWLGPCIGPAAFEVGAEVRELFVASQTGAEGCFTLAAHGKLTADLAGLARLRLRALGITEIYGNDSTEAWCTASNPSRFFSHRRDAGVQGNGFGTTGRMAACVWLS